MSGYSFNGGNEEKIRDHYAEVSNDMEEDFTAPVIDYCIRIEDPRRICLHPELFL